MSSFIKKPRAIYWYFKSFVVKKKKFFFLGFFLGLLLTIYLVSDYALSIREIVGKENSIGMVGKYTLVNLPLQIQQKVSFGLTRITEDGKATPAAALRWRTQSDDKVFLFDLNPNIYWQDGTKFKSFDVNYRLRNVEIRARGDNIIEFKLRGTYASLPWLLSQPLFKKQLMGLGQYKATHLVWENGFLQSLDLINIKDSKDKIIYKFYPSEKQALTALKLKKVSKVEGLKDISVVSRNKDTEITGPDAFQNIVTLFFNANKAPLDEKQIRLGLTYAIPDGIKNEFRRANSPLPITSWYYNKNLKEYNFNDDLATKYLKDLVETKNATDSKRIELTILSVPLYKFIAEKIAKAWSERGVKTTVKVATGLPGENFDVFLAELEVPNDPDQYILWHSTQESNIANMKSPRIDKLLEDGRQTVDEEKRLEIYQQFQKFLVEDDVAVFLFYGKNYTVARQ